MTSPSAPASITDSAISTMLVTSGDSLAKTGTPRGVSRRTAAITPRRLDRVAGEDQPAVLDVRARDVDLDRGDARGVADPAGELGVLPQRRPGDRHDRPGVVLQQPGQVAGQEGVDPGALQADRVEHPRRRLGHPRRRPAGARVAHDRLGDDRAELGDVEELLRAPGPPPRSRSPSSPGCRGGRRPAPSTGRRPRAGSRGRLISAHLPSARRGCRPGSCRRRPSAPCRRRRPDPRRRSAPSGSPRRRRRPAAHTSYRPRCRTPSTPRPRSGSTRRARSRLGDGRAASPSGRRSRRPRSGCA